MWKEKQLQIKKTIDEKLKQIRNLQLGIDDLKEQLRFLRNNSDKNLVVIMECEIKVAESKLKNEIGFVSYLNELIG